MNINTGKIYFIILFFFIVELFTPAYAQDQSPLKIYARERYGYVMKHHPTMGHLQTDRFSLMEVNMSKRYSDTSSWAAYRNYPELGITFLYSSLGENPYLGNAVACFPAATFYWLEEDRHNLKFRFGAGFGWLTKTYSRTENYKNIAIGSHLNIALDASLSYSIRINRKISTEMGIGLTHFSNGSIKKPNKGLNIPNIYAGVEYNFRESIDHKAQKPPPVKKFRLQAGLSSGLKQPEQDVQNIYSVYMLNLSGHYKINVNTSFSLGYDLLHDRSDRVILESHDIAPGDQQNFLKHGLSTGIQLYFSQITFALKTGYYIYALENSKGNIYNIYKLFYNLGNSYSAGINLQAHLARADFISIGIRKRFKL